jgi:hypothetical protein
MDHTQPAQGVMTSYDALDICAEDSFNVHTALFMRLELGHDVYGRVG